MKLVNQIVEPHPVEHNAWLMECSVGHRFVCDDVLKKNYQKLPMIYHSQTCGPLPYTNILAICPECGEDNSHITQTEISV